MTKYDQWQAWAPQIEAALIEHRGHATGGDFAHFLYNLDMEGRSLEWVLWDIGGRQGDEPSATQSPAPAPQPEPNQPPMPPGMTPLLRVEGKTFIDDTGKLFSWHGYSMFLAYRRFLAGDDLRPDLRRLRTHGVNVLRVFGPLPWAETPDYRQELFDTDRLGAFFALLQSEGFYCEFVPICYAFDLARQRELVHAVYVIASRFPNVFIEVANEPHVNKTDPVAIMAGLERFSVLSAYGLYGSYYAKPSSMPAALDYVTIHTQRDAAWHRKARHAQEVQHATGKPCISDEPAKITEPNFDYPGGKNDPARTPAEAVWHAAVCALWTPGSTLHTEEGKWGRVPTPGMLQFAVLSAVSEHVWARIGPEWQTGAYKGGHSSGSPVDGDGLKINGQDIWTYSSVHSNKALSVRCALSAPKAKPGWRVVDQWGPSDSLVRLERV